MCDFQWVGPFWGGEPGRDESHACDEVDGHDGRHRCRCGEDHEPTEQEQKR